MGANSVITDEIQTSVVEVNSNEEVSRNGSEHQNDTKTSFQSIQKEVSESRVMDIETDYLLDVVLATCLSLELERPLFMMIQAPSSSGKSEVLKLMDGYENFYKQHDLTSRTLFSGHEKAKGGFIPEVIGEKGILCIPDFTTVLSARSSDRSAVFSQLRIAYDGEGGRATGVDVRNIVNWKGKIACICAVTQTIEQFKHKASDLGERFLYYRHNVPELDRKEVLRRLRKCRKLNIKQVKMNIQAFLTECKQSLPAITLTEEDEEYLWDAACFISKMRAVVTRDNYKREILCVDPPEEPFRLRHQLTGLLCCLKAIHSDSSDRAMLIVSAVVKSCIPVLRLDILRQLFSSDSMISSLISKEVKLPETTVRRCLEDMHACYLLGQTNDNRNNGASWRITPEIRQMVEKVLVK